MPLPEVLIGFIVTIWEGKKCRMNRILFRTRCLYFYDYVVILASSGRHGYPNNRKPGGWLTAVLLETKWKPANRILQPFNWLFSRLNTVCTRVKLHQVKSEPQNRRISNVEGWVRSPRRRCYNPYEPEASLSHFYKIGRIPYFDIRYSLFDIRYSLFQSFFSDQTGCSQPAAVLI